MQIYQIKIVLIGDGAVGKSTLAKKYLGKAVDREYIMTIGVDFYQKFVEMKDKNDNDLVIKLIIWDIAGQEQWSEVRPGFYIGSSGALLVYDITRHDTYKNAIKWADEFIKNVGKRPIIVIANKIDLRDEAGIISPEDGERLASELASKYGIETDYIETSALYGENVNEAFKRITEMILRAEGLI